MTNTIQFSDHRAAKSLSMERTDNRARRGVTLNVPFISSTTPRIPVALGILPLPIQALTVAWSGLAACS